MGGHSIYNHLMDELSPLFQDIKFNLTFRGYEPDDVDAYVDRVAKVAALVKGRIGELQQRAAAAEANLTRVATTETEATLTRTLLLAQKTADAAIAAAEAEGEQKKREANDYASRVLAEAETDRRRIVAQTESAVATKATEERNQLAKEVLELEQHRKSLADDVDTLERFLADQRSWLAESLASLSSLLEKPGVLRMSAAPAISGAEMDIAISTTSAAAEPGPVEVAEVVEPVEVAEVVEDAVDPIPEVELLREPTVEVAVIPDPAPPISPLPSSWSGDNSTPSPDPQVPASPLRIVTAADLEEDSTQAPQDVAHDATVTDDSSDNALLFEEPGPATSNDPFLDQLRDAAASDDQFDLGDDALAEFFDHDEANSGRNWFNRRR